MDADLSRGDGNHKMKVPWTGIRCPNCHANVSPDLELGLSCCNPWPKSPEFYVNGKWYPRGFSDIAPNWGRVYEKVRTRVFGLDEKILSGQKYIK